MLTVKTTNNFDQCGSRDDKITLYFGGLGQITDPINRFKAWIKCFGWVTTNSCDICTHRLENDKTIEKNCNDAKQVLEWYFHLIKNRVILRASKTVL